MGGPSGPSFSLDEEDAPDFDSAEWEKFMDEGVTITRAIVETGISEAVLRRAISNGDIEATKDRGPHRYSADRWSIPRRSLYLWAGAVLAHRKARSDLAAESRERKALYREMWERGAAARDAAKREKEAKNKQYEELDTFTKRLLRHNLDPKATRNLYYAMNADPEAFESVAESTYNYVMPSIAFDEWRYLAQEARRLGWYAKRDSHRRRVRAKRRSQK